MKIRTPELQLFQEYLMAKGINTTLMNQMISKFRWLEEDIISIWLLEVVAGSELPSSYIWMNARHKMMELIKQENQYEPLEGNDDIEEKGINYEGILYDTKSTLTIGEKNVFNALLEGKDVNQVSALMGTSKAYIYKVIESLSGKIVIVSEKLDQLMWRRSSSHGEESAETPVTLIDQSLSEGSRGVL